jgi:hypothetical protein
MLLCNIFDSQPSRTRGGRSSCPARRRGKQPRSSNTQATTGTAERGDGGCAVAHLKPPIAAGNAQQSVTYDAKKALISEARAGQQDPRHCDTLLKVHHNYRRAVAALLTIIPSMLGNGG